MKKADVFILFNSKMYFFDLFIFVISSNTNFLIIWVYFKQNRKQETDIFLIIIIIIIKRIKIKTFFEIHVQTKCKNKHNFHQYK